MPSDHENFTLLKRLLGEYQDLEYTNAALGWDQQTYMPAGGAEDRSYLHATISRIAHDRFTSPEIGRLLEDLKPYAAQLDPDSDDARLIMVTDRQYRKQVKVPSDLVAEFAQVTTTGQQAWMEARASGNFESFSPYLERIVELRKQYADLFTPYDNIYDPLLDDYEPGMKVADVRRIFDILRPEQVAFLQQVAEQPPIDDSFLHQSLDETKQWNFGVEVISRFGFDWKHGRQDRSAHPFTTELGMGDVRITTRFENSQSITPLMSTMHEAGHGMYAQGIDPAYRRTPLATGASLAMHESQSRLWENLVGRSRDFWIFFYPRWQEFFPEQYGRVNLDTFYRGINKIERSLIRVDSDEASYNLHIMLRLELEMELIEGSLDVRDLPEAWNARMQDYLGLNPPNDSVGVLQDVHWSGGMIGYFSTYALGNLISVQLWEKIHQDIPDLQEQIQRGEFGALLHWLRENVHKYGAKYEPQELVERITGSKIDPVPYLRYLRNKFSEIYNL